MQSPRVIVSLLLSVLLFVVSVPPAHAQTHAQTVDPLVHEIELDAPVAVVWNLFATAEGYQRWAAPKATIDLKIGGAIRSSYDPNSTLHDDATIVNTILSYVPQRMLAFHCTQAPEGFPFAEAIRETWSVVFFEPLEEDRTRLTIIGLGYTESPESQAMRNYFEGANAGLLEVMRTLVGGAERPPAPSRRPASIELGVTIRAAAKDVWRTWSTDAGAKGVLAPDTNIQPRIGGPFELFFLPEPVDGQRGSDGCTVLVHVPGRMISFSWNAPPSFPHVRHMRTWVVVTMTEKDGTMELRLTHLGFDELKAAHPEHAEEIDAAREYLRRAWPSMLERTKAHLEQ